MGTPPRAVVVSPRYPGAEQLGPAGAHSTPDLQPQWSELTEYFKFVKAVFCILVSTCIVESCFSLFTALKGKYRSMLRDGCVVDALLSRQAVDAFADASVSFGDIQLRLDAHKHRLRW